MKESRQQKIERIAVGLAVSDALVELAITTKTISDFNLKIDQHDANRKFDREINAIGYVRSEFYKEVKKMKGNPDYQNPDMAEDEDEEDKP